MQPIKIMKQKTPVNRQEEYPTRQESDLRLPIAVTYMGRLSLEDIDVVGWQVGPISGERLRNDQRCVFVFCSASGELGIFGMGLKHHRHSLPYYMLLY